MNQVANNITFEDRKKKFLKDNIEQIISELRKQFKDPYDTSRELVQNIIDAQSSRAEISTEIEKIDKKTSFLKMHFKDFGVGMSEEERDKFFLNLFKSSKEENSKQIGKYGIGISSVFMLDLEDIIVKSTPDDPSLSGWSMVIKEIQGDIKHGFTTHENNGESGTTITLVKKIWNPEIALNIQKLEERLKFFCDRVRIPIYFNSHDITKPFDLDTDLKISKTTNDLEYVIGVSNDIDLRKNFHKMKRLPRVEFFNNRLKLEETTSNSISSEVRFYDIIVSSSKFAHTFSRDSVIKDKYYEKIISQIEKELPRFFEKSLEVYEKSTKKLEEVRSNLPPIPKISISRRDGRVEETNRLDQLEQFLKANDYRYATGDYVTLNETVETLSKKVEEFKKNHDNYHKAIDEKQQKIKLLERKIINSHYILNQFLNDYKNKSTKESEKKGISRLIPNREFNSNTEKLKFLLPDFVSQYKIIPTMNEGKISITELLDKIIAEKELLKASDWHLSGEKKLIELIKADGRTLLNSRDFIGHTNNPNFDTDYLNQKIVDNLGLESKIRYASSIYSVPVNTKRNVSEYEEFRKTLEKKINKEIAKRYHQEHYNIRFTDKNELDEKYQHHPEIKIDQRGKMNFGEVLEKPGLIKRTSKKITQTGARIILDPFLLNPNPIDFGKDITDYYLNLDNKRVSEQIDLYHMTNNQRTKEIVLNNFVANCIGEPYRLKPFKNFGGITKKPIYGGLFK